jgi:hypothetical protein
MINYNVINMRYAKSTYGNLGIAFSIKIKGSVVGLYIQKSHLLFL